MNISILQKIAILFSSSIIITLMTHSIFTILLLVIIIIVSHIFMGYVKNIENESTKKYTCAVIVLSLFSTIPILNYFGYIGTLTGNNGEPSRNIAWLLGLPFFVLQVAEVYREVVWENKDRPGLLDYSVFLLLFPKFISGPLENWRLIESIKTIRAPTQSHISSGISWIILGLFMKFTIANPLSKIVLIKEIMPPEILISVMAFEFRVYFDLAGYSFIALGMASLMGLQLTLNFAHPFFAENVQRFWQRWHISLGRWFRENILLPLREVLGRDHWFLPLVPLIIFNVSALWHGASMNFLFWGMFHGLCYLIYVSLTRHWQAPRAVGVVAMVAVLLTGRLLFMDSDAPRLMRKIKAMVDIDAWQEGWHRLPSYLSGHQQWRMGFFGLALAALFLVGEYVNLRRHPNEPYKLFLSAPCQIAFVLLLLFATQRFDEGLVYARN